MNKGLQKKMLLQIYVTILALLPANPNISKMELRGQ